MSIKVTINLDNIENKIRDIEGNKEIMLAVHNTFAKRMDPYVPMDTGTLAQSTTITAEYVRYTMPYAHYMYEGVVYGPNIPIVENDVVVGYWSPPNQAKHSTGKPINYSKERHNLATHHWDHAMMRDKGEEFTKDVEDIIINALKKGG